MTRVFIPEGTETEPSVNVANERGGRTLVGTPNPDRLPGTDGPDDISALASDDLLAGGGGDDDISAGAGNDTAAGGIGSDSINGNRGEDSILGGEGDDCIRGGKDNDIVEGEGGNDILYGDRGDDIVRGGEGNDFIFGNRDNDLLEGGAGNDSIFGGKDNDTVDGGAGDDFISGDKGNDILTGGAGADIFFFFFDQDGSYGTDTLTDFNSAEGDKIGLNGTAPGAFEALAGSSSLSSDQFAVIEDFNPAGSDGTTAAIVYDPNSGLIYYNPTSAAGDEEQIARIDPGSTLTNEDFEIF